nr:WD repeat-containing protein 87-like isoform X2 [Danaus plexippus plexippus]
MARKGQVAIQDNIETNEEFEETLMSNFDRLLCLEVYSEFCGHCLATGNAIRKGKLEIGQDRIAMVRALADNIDVLSRFRNRSEPIFLFISKGKLIRAMFGANGLELCRIMEEELENVKIEAETGIERPKQEIEELLPEEAAKIEEDLKMEEEAREKTERLRVLTTAARKKRVCERLARHVRGLNFILYWPHCHKAHLDLYEKWDLINVQVAAKETIQMTEELVKEALYMSDVDPNEACIHALMNGEALVVLFKMFDTDDRDFVKLMRHTLYEEIPVPKEDLPPEKQLPPIPAFERYATISKTAREVRRERYEARMEKLRQEKEDRDRLAAEQARLAREEEEERQRLEKQRQEEERMARIQAGLPADPEPEPAQEAGEEGGEEAVEGEETEVAETEDIEEPEQKEEEQVEVEEEFHSDVSVEDEEYIPPGGLFVPGLYTPPNDLAKANALAYFYPKIVSQITPIESEFLPPHVLVMFTIEKRHDVKDIMDQFPDEILNYGIFIGDDPTTAQHLAYTIKQYNHMSRIRKHNDRLALMVSRKRSLPMLQLAGVNPCYISHDVESGEKDCLIMFPVGYGDDYEEEESVHEEAEEAVEEQAPEQEVVEVVNQEEQEEDEEEDD